MKHNMISKITKAFCDIGTIPKNIIKYGTIGSILLFICAGITYSLNNFFVNNSVIMYNSIFLIRSSTTIFAEVIIGALVIEHLSRSMQ